MSFIKNGSAILSRHLIQHTTYVQLLACLRGNVLENQRGKKFSRHNVYTKFACACVWVTCVFSAVNVSQIVLNKCYISNNVFHLCDSEKKRPLSNSKSLFIYGQTHVANMMATIQGMQHYGHHSAPSGSQMEQPLYSSP